MLYCRQPPSGQAACVSQKQKGSPHGTHVLPHDATCWVYPIPCNNGWWWLVYKGLSQKMSIFYSLLLIVTGQRTHTQMTIRSINDQSIWTWACMLELLDYVFVPQSGSKIFKVSDLDGKGGNGSLIRWRCTGPKSVSGRPQNFSGASGSFHRKHHKTAPSSRWFGPMSACTPDCPRKWSTPGSSRRKAWTYHPLQQQPLLLYDFGRVLS